VQARKEKLAKEEAARATAASGGVEEEILDEVEDYGEDSFSESVVDSPPPGTSNSRLPATASARSPAGTKKPPAVVHHKASIETDDVVEEISMESIQDDIDVASDLEVSG
jgi:hypothetical protein